MKDMPLTWLDLLSSTRWAIQVSLTACARPFWQDVTLSNPVQLSPPVLSKQLPLTRVHQFKWYLRIISLVHQFLLRLQPLKPPQPHPPPHPTLRPLSHPNRRLISPPLPGGPRHRPRVRQRLRPRHPHPQPNPFLIPVQPHWEGSTLALESRPLRQ